MEAYNWFSYWLFGAHWCTHLQNSRMVAVLISDRPCCYSNCTTSILAADNASQNEVQERGSSLCSHPISLCETALWCDPNWRFQQGTCSRSESASASSFGLLPQLHLFIIGSHGSVQVQRAVKRVPWASIMPVACILAATASTVATNYFLVPTISSLLRQKISMVYSIC